MLLKKIFLGGILLIGIGLFLVTNQAMAFSDEPCSQFNYEWCAKPAMNATNGSWSITLNNIDPVPDTDPPQWDWQYTITSSPSGGFTGSNFVGFLLPDCCNTAERIIVEATSIGSFTCFPVSEGEPTINFGRYNNQAFVCKGTPDSTGNWSIRANTQYKTRSTIIIKSGKDVFEFEMAVPGCPLAPVPTEPLIGARTFSECTNFGQDTIDPIPNPGGDPDPLPATADDVSFYIKRTDDTDGCVSEIWRCVGLDCPDCTTADGCPTTDPVICEPIDPSALPSNYVLETSFLRTCPDENTSVTHGSPFYLYRTYSGGILYQSCLDLATYRWVHLSNCF